jgi:hypothetical protein
MARWTIGLKETPFQRCEPVPDLLQFTVMAETPVTITLGAQLQPDGLCLQPQARRFILQRNGLRIAHDPGRIRPFTDSVEPCAMRCTTRQTR